MDEKINGPDAERDVSDVDTLLAQVGNYIISTLADDNAKKIHIPHIGAIYLHTVSPANFRFRLSCNKFNKNYLEKFGGNNNDRSNHLEKDR